MCLVFSLIQVTGQNLPGPTIMAQAPTFVANSTKGIIHFPQDYYGKWKILFSHPDDFTPVCTTEILALADMQEQFHKANTVIIDISTEGVNSHLAWINSMENIERSGKAKVKINFPMISDPTLEISRKYGILSADTGKLKDVRAVFIIDPENKIQAIFYYPDWVGRNIEEIYRTLLALQMYDRREVMTPANWQKGDDVIIPCPKSIDESDKMAARSDSSSYRLAWYLWFRKY
jgi:peroxiredoxin (alkyl hydroperoxide reductase subunit C)